MSEEYPAVFGSGSYRGVWSDAFFILSLVNTELAAVGPCEKEKKMVKK